MKLSITCLWIFVFARFVFDHLSPALLRLAAIILAVYANCALILAFIIYGIKLVDWIQRWRLTRWEAKRRAYLASRWSPKLDGTSRSLMRAESSSRETGGGSDVEVVHNSARAFFLPR